MNSPNSVIVFHHIPKTGGSSFINMVESDGYWTPRPISDCTDIRLLARDVAMAQAKNRPLPPLFVYGHNSMGVADIFPGDVDVQSIIFLRDPRDILLSTFRFRSDQNIIGQHRTLETFLEFSAQRDAMTDFLGAGNLDRAKQNLMAIDHICLVADYEGAVSRLIGPLHLSQRSFPIRKKSHTPCDPTPADEQRIADLTQKDRQLYEFALSLLDQRATTAPDEAHKISFYMAEESSSQPPEALPMDQVMALSREQATQEERDRARWTLCQPMLACGIENFSTPENLSIIEQIYHLDDRHLQTYLTTLEKVDTRQALRVCEEFLEVQKTLPMPLPEAHYNRYTKRIQQRCDQLRQKITAPAP